MNKTHTIENVKVHSNIDISVEEARAYVNRYEEKYGNVSELKRISLKFDEDSFVNIEYKFDNVPFQRIRRITGYLVESTSKWNDAKKAELNKRIIHDKTNEKE